MSLNPESNLRGTGLSSPARQARAITPADGVDLALGITRGIYVGGAGNLSVILADDTVAVVHAGVAAGSFLPLQVKHVQSTGTTATNIVGWF